MGQISPWYVERGHPLVGETVYVRDLRHREGRELASRRLLLHAASLGFAHPVTGAWVELESELPPDFVAALAALER